MSSLRAIDKKITKRRQVYKPILDNPFTNESQLWPHVSDQQLVFEMLQSDILSLCRTLKDTENQEWPLDVLYTFNEINSFLTDDSNANESVLLFACTKDQGIASVLLQQVPLIAYLSKADVCLVQLPRNSATVIVDALPLDEHPFEGLLMIRCNDKVNTHFVKTIKSKVEEQSIPWLNKIKYQPASIKLVKTTAPIISKNDNQKQKQKVKQETQTKQIKRSADHSFTNQNKKQKTSK